MLVSLLHLIKKIVKKDFHEKKNFPHQVLDLAKKVAKKIWFNLTIYLVTWMSIKFVSVFLTLPVYVSVTCKKSIHNWCWINLRFLLVYIQLNAKSGMKHHTHGGRERDSSNRGNWNKNSFTHSIKRFHKSHLKIWKDVQDF